MNKSILIVLIITAPLILFSSEKEISKPDDSIVKRTIVILPFINKNNVKKFSYIAGSLRDALKAKILESKIFNLISFSATDEKIIKSGYGNDAVIDESNAKDIAVKLKADITITGKYIIIEDNIMIQIDAVDVFTGQTAVSTVFRGDVGLDLFRLIDESTIDLTKKLAQKFKKVDRSYFTEMSKLIQKEEMLKIFTPQVKSGIALCSGGGLLFFAGLPVMIFDLAYYYNIYNNNLYYIPRTDQGYNDYVYSYNTFFGLLAFSLTSVCLGMVLAGVGIPLIAYKKKEVNVGLNIELGKELKFEFYMKI
jgi:TolB-like protein